MTLAITAGPTQSVPNQQAASNASSEADKVASQQASSVITSEKVAGAIGYCAGKAVTLVAMEGGKTLGAAVGYNVAPWLCKTFASYTITSAIPGLQTVAAYRMLYSMGPTIVNVATLGCTGAAALISNQALEAPVGKIFKNAIGYLNPFSYTKSSSADTQEMPPIEEEPSAQSSSSAIPVEDSPTGLLAIDGIDNPDFPPSDLDFLDPNKSIFENCQQYLADKPWAPKSFDELMKSLSEEASNEVEQYQNYKVSVLNPYQTELLKAILLTISSGKDISIRQQALALFLETFHHSSGPCSLSSMEFPSSDFSSLSSNSSLDSFSSWVFLEGET